MKTDDLDFPWSVVEEADTHFPDVTWQRICYRSDFGPGEWLFDCRGSILG